MAKRQTKRKVSIVLKRRNLSDSPILLQAVEDIFHPGAIDISVEDAEAELTCLDEQVETRAKELVADLLDAVARQHEEETAARGEGSKAVVAILPTVSRRNALDQVGRWTRAGWRVFARFVIPSKEGIERAKGLGEIAKGLGEFAKDTLEVAKDINPDS